MQAAEPDAPARSEAEALLKNPTSVTADFIHDPSHRDVVSVLRKEAQSTTDDRARSLLLNAEDSPTIQTCLEELRGDDAYRRVAAARALGSSGQPKLIQHLADDLHRNEPAKSQRVSAGEEVVRITPASVLAAEAILRIVAQTPRFTQPTRDWAAALPVASENRNMRENVRAAVRLWWQQNRQALVVGEYSQVLPPRKQ